MGETVLVIGGTGGREHELARVMSSEVDQVFISPGNDLTGNIGENVDLTIDQVPDFVSDNAIDLTVIGPEGLLSKDLAGTLRKQGNLVFGPDKNGARLETSKIFGAVFCDKYGIPAPNNYPSLTYDNGINFLKATNVIDYVIKADGEAGGKGVVLPGNYFEAIQALKDMLVDGKYDGAGETGILFQERLYGPEVSAFAVTDGKDFVLLPLSQDHKRRNDGDEGLNTGGMGAYAPVPESIVNQRQYAQIMELTQRTIDGLNQEFSGAYRGVVFQGLMMDENDGGQPKLIEYNARFGDPETQVILPLLQKLGVNVYELLKSAAAGELLKISLSQNVGYSALTTCIAENDYPTDVKKGASVEYDTESHPDVILHGAGIKDGKVSGGRIAYVTSVSETLEDAKENVDDAIFSGIIQVEGGFHHRRDIGYQALSIS